MKFKRILSIDKTEKNASNGLDYSVNEFLKGVKAVHGFSTEHYTSSFGHECVAYIIYSE